MTAATSRHQFHGLIARAPATLRGLRDRAALRLMAECGLKNSELIKIRVADIRGRTIRIQSCHQGVRLKDGLAPVHLITVSEAAIGDVIRWLQAAKINDGFVFRGTAKGGKVAETAMSANAVRQLVARYDYGKRGHNPRGLRRGFAVELMGHGARLSELRGRLRVREIKSILALTGFDPFIGGAP